MTVDPIDPLPPLPGAKALVGVADFDAGEGVVVGVYPSAAFAVGFLNSRFMGGITLNELIPLPVNRIGIGFCPDVIPVRSFIFFLGG